MPAIEMRLAGLPTKTRAMRSTHSRDRCSEGGNENLTPMMRWIVLRKLRGSAGSSKG